MNKKWYRRKRNITKIITMFLVLLVFTNTTFSIYAQSSDRVENEESTKAEFIDLPEVYEIPQEPETTPEPVVEEKPETTPEPVVEEKPEATPEPVVEEKPEATQEPAVEEKPVATSASIEQGQKLKWQARRRRKNHR